TLFRIFIDKKSASRATGKLIVWGRYYKGLNILNNESIFFKIGKKIGYWYAANRESLVRELFGGIVRRLPGGRWLWKYFR
ncbi:hypothetical protein ACFL6K_04980, partial [Candidatus Latescibacterota bacterium]